MKSEKGSVQSISLRRQMIILMVIWAINRIDFDDLSRALKRLFRSSGVSADGATIGIAVLAVVLFVVILALVKKIRTIASDKRFTGVKTSARRETTAVPLHSHDRLSGYADGSCSSEEHWKKQLDGFLSAGIIDRNEYRVLLERRRK